MASGTENRYVSIFIDGNAANDTLKKLRDSSRELKNQLDKLPRSSEEFAKKSELLREVEGRLKSLREEAKGVSSSFNNLKEELVGIGKGMLAGFSVAGIIAAGRKIITQNAEISDSLAGVMKTTGLTQVEVDALNRSLSKLNTRTAKEELLGLAQVAGKLGISDLKQIEGFVRAADMIGVALGEDLGGTEQAVTALGKLADIFKLKDEYGIEQALLKIGSAINSLGAAGTANEGYMIDFTNRLAGIAPAANISIGDVLGLAATLDSLGQSGEKSSTAIGKFLVEMGGDVAKFAKIAKMDIKEFTELLQNDANEAFLKVLEASNSTSGGISALAKSMGALELKDSGAIAALGALANNIDKVREAQKMGNEELEKGTSIITEFDTANNTLGGNLSKLGKIIAEVWDNGRIRSWLTDFTGWIIDTRSDVDKLTDSFYDQKTAIENLEKNVNPLITRYDELKSKGKLSRDEQVELQSIIQKIAEYIPTAVSQWDAFGHAMDINRGKVNDFAQAQRELLQIKNKEAIQDLQNLYKSSSNMADIMADRANKSLKDVQSGNISVMSKIFGFDEKDIKTSTRVAQEQSKEAYESLIRLKDEFGVQLSGDQDKFLYAYRLKNNIKTTSTSTNVISTTSGNQNDSGTSGGGTGGKTKSKGKSEAEKEAERAKELYDKLLKEDEAFKLAKDIADGSWYKQQLAKEAEQYTKQIDRWKEFLDKKGVTTAQKSEAETSISNLENQRDEALAKRKVKLEEEVSTKITELREKLNSKLLTERAREEQSINDYYKALAEKYKGNGDMQALIEKNRSVDLANAKSKEEERFHKEAEKLQQQSQLSKKTGADRELAEMKLKIDAEIAALREKFSIELQETEIFKQAEKEIYDRYATEAKAKQDQENKNRNQQYKEAAIDTAQTISDSISSINQANRDRDLETALTKLDTERERELSNKNLTESQKKAINSKYDALERKEKERAWKAQQKADIIQAGINTALAFTRALPNWINAAAVGVAGAAQIAVIASQPVPQFFHGGYTNENPQGWVRKPTVFGNSASGRAFSAGENFMSEYVVSSDQLRDPLVADFVSMMEAGRTSEIAGLMPQTTVVQQQSDNSRLEGLMVQMIQAYNQTQDKKVVILYSDLEDARDTKVNIEYGANA